MWNKNIFPAADGTLMGKAEERARILARVISMPVQFSYLRIQRFQWLLDIIECVGRRFLF